MLQVGQCLKFDGSLRNYATLPTVDLRDLPGFSISFWIKYADDIKVVNSTVFDFQSEDESHRISFGKFGISKHASITITGNDASLVVLNGFDCCDWMHYTVVVRRLPQGNIEVFKDGETVETCRVATGQSSELGTCAGVQSYNYPNQVFTSNYMAKSHEGHPFTYFSGRIDAFGVFPWPLTSAQITQLRNNNVARKMPFPFKATCPVHATSTTGLPECACEAGTYYTVAANALDHEGTCEQVSTCIIS